MRRAFYTLLLAALIVFGGVLPQSIAGEDSHSVACSTMHDVHTETDFAGEPEAGVELSAATSSLGQLAAGRPIAEPYTGLSLISLDRPPA